MDLSRKQSRRWFGKAVICIGLAVPLLGYLLLQVTGSITVVDAGSSVNSVVVISGDGRQQRLRELWGGYILGVPRLAGALRIQCDGGGHATMGYAAPGLHTRLRVNGCASRHERQQRLRHHFSP
jgi:hypothetical protein